MTDQTQTNSEDPLATPVSSLAKSIDSKPAGAQSTPAPRKRAPAPTPFDASLQELTARGKKLRIGTLIFGGAAIALAIIGGVFYTLGVAAVPTTTIGQISVPDSIAQAFQSAGTAGDIGSGFLLETATESIFSWVLNSTLFKAFCAFAAIGYAAFALLSGSYTKIPAAIMIGAMPYVSGAMVEVFNPEQIRSPNSFVSAIESRDVVALEQLLGSREGLDDSAKAYVLAQASVSNGSSSKWISLTAKNLREGSIKEKFTVPAKVAYAIEVAAQSPELSEQAEKYRQGAISEVVKWKRISNMALLLAGLIGLIATVHESLAQIIFRRVRRITRFLDPVLTSFIRPRS